MSNIKYLFAFACLQITWLYPFSAGASADALQQIVAMGALALASLLFGMHTVHRMVLIVAAMFILVISITPSYYIGNQIVGIAGIVLTILGCSAGAHLQKRTKGLVWLLLGVVVAAFANALESLLQWLGLANELWPWIVDTGRRGLAFGTFRQTNLFATFLCVGIVCTAWLLHLRRLSSTMAWTLVFVMAFGVAASGSRTGGLELAALCLAGIIWRRQQATEVTRLLVGTVFLFGLATLVLPMIAQLHGFGFVSGAERMAHTSTDNRLLIWQNAVTMIAERPWTGWGWLGMGYGHYVTLFEHRFNELLDHAHNLPLQLAVEFGIPFTLVFFGILAWAVYKGKPWQVFYEPHSAQHELTENRSFAWAILLTIAGIHSMLEKPLWYFGFLFLSGFACGYLLVFPSGRVVKDTYISGALLFSRGFSVTLITLALVAWQQYEDILRIYAVPFNDQNAQRTAVANANGAWLFRGHLDFMKIGMTEVTPEHALEVKQTAYKLLQFSAEPRVIQPLLLSLWYLHETVDLQFHAMRFCHAFPSEFARWQYFYEHHPILQGSGNLTLDCQLAVGSSR